MHEEATTITTTAASSKVACNIINNSHQSITIDNATSPTATTTISIIHHLHQQHPNATVIENYTPSSNSTCSATTLAIPTSNLTSQIVSPQTKIIISSNADGDDVITECDDVSSVILNGAIANPNDPNVLIVETNPLCDKNELTLNISNEVQQQQQMEIEIVESAVIATGTSDDGGIEGGSGSVDESDAGEGESIICFK
jgi:hypothetical protein